MIGDINGLTHIPVEVIDVYFDEKGVKKQRGILINFYVNKDRSAALFDGLSGVRHIGLEQIKETLTET